MQSRTIVRIEGDLVSLVTEMVEREVLLSDFEAELSRSHLDISPRLPSGTRYWLHAGMTDRSVIVLEQEPGHRTIEYVANRYDSEPTTYRLALPYVVFVVSVTGEQILSLGCYFRTEPLRSLEDPLLAATLPNTDDSGVVCLGSVRVSGANLGERIDALVAAFWGSRFNADIRRHPLPFSGGLRSWASRSRRAPLVALSFGFAPTGRTLRQVITWIGGLAPDELPAPTIPVELATVEVHTPEPEVIENGGETDAHAA